MIRKSKNKKNKSTIYIFCLTGLFFSKDYSSSGQKAMMVSAVLPDGWASEHVSLHMGRMANAGFALSSTHGAGVKVTLASIWSWSCPFLSPSVSVWQLRSDCLQRLLLCFLLTKPRDDTEVHQTLSSNIDHAVSDGWCLGQSDTFWVQWRASPCSYYVPPLIGGRGH